MSSSTNLPIQPFYIVPLLLEQPTWGGKYIAQFKTLTDNRVANLKLGQSYELYGQSMLVASLGQDRPLQLASADNLGQITTIGDTSQMISLATLINANPTQVLGAKVVDQYGPVMPLLNKFTQARSNSYQLHVKPGREFDQWQAKPESWYYFEPGDVTLGIKPDADMDAYKDCCQKIYQQSLAISQKIKAGQVSLEQGREELTSFINQNHPSQFVNQISTETNDIIDLSEGGVHHSWETNPKRPLGNIVYEVQLDRQDQFSTIRSFDQGSIKADGAVRPLQIDDYFEAIDTNPIANLPQTHMKPSQTQTDESGLGKAEVTTIFKNQYYQMRKIKFEDEYAGHATTSANSFHHLFVKCGPVQVVCQAQTFDIPTGWSIFLPAAISRYQLKALANPPACVLQTFI